jgi:hypothetical protein
MLSNPCSLSVCQMHTLCLNPAGDPGGITCNAAASGDSLAASYCGVDMLLSMAAALCSLLHCWAPCCRASSELLKEWDENRLVQKILKRRKSVRNRNHQELTHPCSCLAGQLNSRNDYCQDAFHSSLRGKILSILWRNSRGTARYLL